MLSDPRLRQVQATIGHILQTAEDYNDPRIMGERIGGGGKPGSRPPGEPQCEWLVNRLVDIMERAAASGIQAIDAAKPRERHSGEVTSVGGMEVPKPTFSEREQRIVQHLVVKYQSIPSDVR